ncbi:MAG: hypothetical protein QXM43_03630 [Desulfurococcaceae archaeon]
MMIWIIILTPFIKYLSPPAVYGAHDTLAHYSFSKWILVNAAIPQNDELYYSDTYGLHPGNGVIPALFSMLSGIPVGVAMTITLVLSYMVYILVFHLFLKIINVRFFTFVSLLGVSLLYFFDYYNGTALSYAFISLILFGFFKLFAKRVLCSGWVVSMYLVFIGLMLTHYSSTIHMSFLLLLLLIELISKKLYLKSSTTILLGMLTLFVAYELYVDIILMGKNIKNAILILYQNYLREKIMLEESIQKHSDLNLLQLLGFFISYTGKPIILLFITILVWSYYTLRLIRKYIFKAKTDSINDNEVERIYKFLTFTFPLYIVVYAGVGSIVGVDRMLVFTQIFSALLITYLLSEYISNRRKYFKDKYMSVLLIGFILLGFISNYPLTPFSPTITFQGEHYKPAAVNVVSVYPYMAVMFINNFVDPNIRVVTLSPYITFGYTDLIWNAIKYPRRGFINAGRLPYDAVSCIKLLMTYKQLIIPLYLTDKLSGRPGFKSYYLEPYKLLCQTILIYNNGFYALFLT